MKATLNVVLINQANKERVENLEEMIKYFLEDKRLHRFMRLCLDIGNLVNQGTRRGNAHGFKFASFKSFASCKGNDGKQYLLPYIFEEISEQHPEALGFYEDMKTCISAAMNFDIDDVITGVGTLKTKFTQLKTTLEASEKMNPPDENFIANFQPFYNENVKQTIELEDKAKKMKEDIISFAVKMGDDPTKIKGLKSTVIIKPYNDLFIEFGKTIDDIIKAQEKKKKSDAKKSKKEKKKKVDED